MRYFFSFVSLVAVILYAQTEHPEIKHMVNACDNKSMPTACYELGLLYEQGLGVKQDKNISQIYFKKACELHFQKACDHLDNNKSEN